MNAAAFMIKAGAWVDTDSAARDRVDDGEHVTAAIVQYVDQLPVVFDGLQVLSFGAQLNALCRGLLLLGRPFGWCPMMRRASFVSSSRAVSELSARLSTESKKSAKIVIISGVG